MINRVLIRMKTVQLLYSYLLVEKPFALENQPSAPTKEKRFAYNLYLDLIYLIDRLGLMITGKNKTLPLADSRFVIKTQNDEKIKALRNQYSGSNFPLEAALPGLAEKIKESLLFKEYEKKRDNGEPNENFWENVYKSIILPDKILNDLIQGLPNYSLSGLERMKPFMEDTFKNFYSSKGDIREALNALEMSMQKARNLYMRLLALPVELTKLRLDQLEKNRRKILATNEDLNPDMRFVNNRLPSLIEKNKDFEEYTDSMHLSWRAEDPELLELLLKNILRSEIYKNYIAKPQVDLTEDIDFWKEVLSELILNDVNFLEYLENKSVFWNDDLEIMASFVMKTLKRFEHASPSESPVLPMYKDGENGKDAKFGAELFEYVVRNKDLYKKEIEDTLEQEKWAPERLAFMDVVITMTAMAEILNYPEIPIAVSVNEYVEIAKSYSSEKSGQFVNGLLACLIKKYQEEKRINKG